MKPGDWVMVFSYSYRKWMPARVDGFWQHGVRTLPRHRPELIELAPMRNVRPCTPAELAEIEAADLATPPPAE